MKLLTVVMILILFLMSSCAQEVAQINVDEVHKAVVDSADVFVLDVRTRAEYDGPLGHIEGAVLIPLHKLENRLSELETEKGKKIIVVCRSGNRSGIATRMLNEKGFNAVNMVGGMLAWNKRFPDLKKTDGATVDTVK